MMSTPFFNLFFGQIRSHNKRVLRTRHKVSGPQTLGVAYSLTAHLARAHLKTLTCAVFAHLRRAAGRGAVQLARFFTNFHRRLVKKYTRPEDWKKYWAAKRTRPRATRRANHSANPPNLFTNFRCSSVIGRPGATILHASASQASIAAFASARAFRHVGESPERRHSSTTTTDQRQPGGLRRTTIFVPIALLIFPCLCV